MESNPDWNMCIDHNGMRMGRCVHACNGNEACELDCLAGFKTRQMDCPCEVSISLVASSTSLVRPIYCNLCYSKIVLVGVLVRIILVQRQQLYQS